MSSSLSSRPSASSRGAGLSHLSTTWVAGCLVVQLALPLSLIAQDGMMTRPAARVEPTMSGRLLTEDEKILQVLNRFTYGPRPGELERVRAVGIKAWFTQQLNADGVDDSALDERLQSFPAWSTA